MSIMSIMSIKVYKVYRHLYQPVTLYHPSPLQTKKNTRQQSPDHWRALLLPTLTATKSHPLIV